MTVHPAPAPPLVQPPAEPSPPPARKTRRPAAEIRPGEASEVVAIASSAFTVVAIVCTWLVVQLLVLGGVSEQRAQHLLYDRYRTELALATAPTGALDYNGKAVAEGAPVALLTIPALDLQQVVVSGTSSGDLLSGPGHLRSTPLPGQAGISVVFGRAATYGGPFRHVGELTVGAKVVVQNAQGRVIYSVADVRRAGDPIPAAPTGTQGRLTLVSAEGAGHLGALRPRAAVYVDAVTDKALPAGAVAGAAPSSEQAMARDTGALPTLVLLLAGLVALVLAVAFATRRFGVVLVWLFATPVAIALAWSSTDQVMRLLPNLM